MYETDLVFRKLRSIDSSQKIYSKYKNLLISRKRKTSYSRIIIIHVPRSIDSHETFSLTGDLRARFSNRSRPPIVENSSKFAGIEGGEKMQQQPAGSSPYSSHGSPLRTPMSSGHGTPQDSPHAARHRRDSEHSAGVGSRRGSSDVVVVSPLPDAPSGSPDTRQPRRRADYSPHQGRSRDSRFQSANLRQLNETNTPLTRGNSQFG